MEKVWRTWLFLPFFQSLWIDYAEVTKKEDMTWTISLWYARARNSWKRPRILHSIAQKGWDFFPFFVIWQKRKKFRNWHFASSLDFSTLLSDVVCDFSLFCIAPAAPPRLHLALSPFFYMFFWVREEAISLYYRIVGNPGWGSYFYRLQIRMKLGRKPSI